MEPAEIELVRASLRNVLATHAAADVPAALLAADWLELVEAEPEVAIGALGEEHGRALAVTPALDLVLLHGAGLAVDAATAFVLPPLRREAALAGTATAAGLRVEGLVLGGHARAAHLVVPGEAGLVRVPASALRFEAVGGFHPELGLQRARGEVPAARLERAASVDAWTSALAAGRRFLAAELVGLVERMLASTVEYVLARKQFGREIGSFQAVKHRLADVRVALGAARAAVAAAWQTGDPTSALAAKILAVRAHRLASTHCHQVQGGIAFTTEHGFHRLIQRGHLLDGLLGAADDLVRELGRSLIATRRVPRVPQIAAP
jgi:hypothetical protein